MLTVGYRVPKRTAFAFGLAAMLMITGVSSASAGHTAPFRGSFTENITGQFACQPGDLCASAATAPGHDGSATVIGTASEGFMGVVNFAVTDQANCHPDSATGVITSSETPADTIFVSSAGKLCLGSGTDNGIFVIEGGTGHFAGASGGGIYTSNVNLGTGVSVETYNGFLTTAD